MSMSVSLPLEGLIKQKIESGEAKNSQEVEEKLQARLYQMELDRKLEQRIKGESKSLDEALKHFKKY